MKQRVKSIERKLGMAKTPICIRWVIDWELDKENPCVLRNWEKVSPSVCQSCAADVSRTVIHIHAEVPEDANEKEGATDPA